MWWCTSAIPTLGRRRREHHKGKVTSVTQWVSLSPAWLCETLPQKPKGKETETTSNKRRKRETEMYSYMSILVINMWLSISLYIFLHLKNVFSKTHRTTPQLLVCLSHGDMGVQIVLKFRVPPLLHKLSVHLSGFLWRIGSYSYATFGGGGLLHNICPIELSLWGFKAI